MVHQAYNVLRYEIGQKYASHFDSFNPNEYGVLKSQRVCNIPIYMYDWMYVCMCVVLLFFFLNMDRSFSKLWVSYHFAYCIFFSGCLLFVIFVRRWGRWRNHVSLWGMRIKPLTLNYIINKNRCYKLFLIHRMNQTWMLDMITSNALVWKWSHDKETVFCFIRYS